MMSSSLPMTSSGRGFFCGDARISFPLFCRPDMYDKAKERVEEILASPQKKPLPDKVIGKLEDIMRRADEALKE